MKPAPVVAPTRPCLAHEREPPLHPETEETTTMKRTRTHRSLLRRTMIASALAAATAVTAVAPPEAHAETATEVTATAVASYLGNKLLSAMFSTGGSFLWESVFSGASSTLSSTDLTAIQDIIREELTAHELEDATDDADSALAAASEYYRGTTKGDLEKAKTKAAAIVGYTNSLLQNLDDYGMAGSSTYLTMAALRISFLREQYEIDYALHKVDPSTYDYQDGYLASLRVNVANQAGTVLAQLNGYDYPDENENLLHYDGFEETFDAQFSAVSVSATQRTNDFTSKCYSDPEWSSNAYSDDSAAYCFSNPGGTSCAGSFDAYKCYSGDRAWHTTTTDAIDAKAQANILLQQAKMSYRDSQLAPQYYELRRSLTRIADGDFEYCGNGTCAIGEIDSCADDCAGQFDEIGNFTKNTLGPSTLGSTSEAWLQWQADGNLVLYDVTTSPASIRWQADLLTGTTGYKVVFASSSGNLLIRDSSGSKLWGALSSGLGSDGRLVLLGKTLYLVNGDGTYDADGTLHGTGRPVWSSDADSHRYAELEDRFCYDTSATITVLQSTTGKLKWTGSGELQAYSTWTTGSTSGSTLTWSTGTSGAYLCNQEDGNLVIYSSTGDTLWSSGTSRGVGGHLVMVGDQLRTTTDSGDLLWTSPICSATSCTQDDRVASLGTSTFTTLTKSQAQTILENDKAKLEWQSDGNLVLYNKATGDTIYESGTAGTGAKLVYGPSGLIVSDASSKAKWTLPAVVQAGSIVLADCNLFVSDASSGEAQSATDTSCDDTAN